MLSLQEGDEWHGAESTGAPHFFGGVPSIQVISQPDEWSLK
jgi:hypothetical protein